MPGPALVLRWSKARCGRPLFAPTVETCASIGPNIPSSPVTDLTKRFLFISKTLALWSGLSRLLTLQKPYTFGEVSLLGWDTFLFFSIFWTPLVCGRPCQVCLFSLFLIFQHLLLELFAVLGSPTTCSENIVKHTSPVFFISRS